MNVTKLIPGLILLVVGFAGGYVYNRYYQRQILASDANVSVKTNTSVNKMQNTDNQASSSVSVDNSQSDQEAPKTTSSRPKAKELTVDTTNWTNYSDKANGLTFKYPNGWKIKDNSGITNGQKYSTKTLIGPENTADRPNVKMTFIFNSANKPADTDTVKYLQKGDTVLKIELISGDDSTNEAIVDTISYK